MVPAPAGSRIDMTSIVHSCRHRGYLSVICAAVRSLMVTLRKLLPASITQLPLARLNVQTDSSAFSHPKRCSSDLTFLSGSASLPSDIVVKEVTKSHAVLCLLVCRWGESTVKLSCSYLAYLQGRNLRAPSPCKPSKLPREFGQ